MVAGFHGDGTPGIVVFCAFVAGFPLVLVLPPLIWGWLTYRVMAFYALAEHASKDERREVLRRHRVTLLGHGDPDGLPWCCTQHCVGFGRGVCRSVCGSLAVGHLDLHAGFCVFIAVVCSLLLAGAGAIACRQFCVWAPPLLCAQQTVLLYRARQGRRSLHQASPSTRLKSMAPSFGLIIVGDEILSGKRADKHLPKVIELLGARGLALSYAD